MVFAGIFKRVKNGIKNINNKLKNAVDPLGLFHNKDTGESKLTKVNDTLKNAVDPFGLFHKKNNNSSGSSISTDNSSGTTLQVKQTGVDYTPPVTDPNIYNNNNNYNDYNRRPRGPPSRGPYRDDYNRRGPTMRPREPMMMPRGPHRRPTMRPRGPHRDDYNNSNNTPQVNKTGVDYKPVLPNNRRPSSNSSNRGTGGRAAYYAP